MGQIRYGLGVIEQRGDIEGFLELSTCEQQSRQHDLFGGEGPPQVPRQLGVGNGGP